MFNLQELLGLLSRSVENPSFPSDEPVNWTDLGNKNVITGNTGIKSKMRPSDRDYPGKTNYGVPEDNMIDTANGYVTRGQYDQMYANKIPMRATSQPVQMNQRKLQGGYGIADRLQRADGFRSLQSPQPSEDYDFAETLRNLFR